MVIVIVNFIDFIKIQPVNFDLNKHCIAFLKINNS